MVGNLRGYQGVIESEAHGNDRSKKMQQGEGEIRNSMAAEQLFSLKAM